jgi:hypothetical protein
MRKVAVPIALVALLVPGTASAHAYRRPRAPTIAQARRVLEATSPNLSLDGCHRAGSRVICRAHLEYQICEVAPAHTCEPPGVGRYVMAVHWKGRMLVADELWNSGAEGPWLGGPGLACRYRLEAEAIARQRARYLGIDRELAC